MKRELENAYDPCAVQMLNISEELLGYVPRYYSKGVCRLLEEGKKIICHIYHVDKSKNCNECIKVLMNIQ